MTTPTPIQPDHPTNQVVTSARQSPPDVPSVLLESLIEALARQVVLDFHGSEAGSGVTAAHIVLALATLLALAICPF